MAGLILVLLIVSAGLWRYFVAKIDEDIGSEHASHSRGPATLPMSIRNSTQPTASTMAGGPTTSLQTTQPVKSWTPPRFTARRRQRNRMVKVIRSYGLKDQAVLNAMAAVPRHQFVPNENSSQAYTDRPLPIGYGQTISQPYIVAEMTRLLKLTPGSRVLEIGTGSGYQAAVLTEFTPQVHTIEIVEPLAQAAKKRLKRLGYHVVQVRAGDGYYGWPDKAPFEAIIVTAAAGQIPPPLIKQLAPGGRMIIPVGGALATQWLTLVEKDKAGTVRSSALMPVRFVPFTRQDGGGR